MPKYTPTHQRLQLRAAMQMAGYATLETSVKQHINEMIDDLRKECQKNQIATNGVMSALYATQKQHIKELRELSETLTTYKEAHTRICESIAVRAVRTMPAESTSHYGNTAGAATTDSGTDPMLTIVRQIFDCTARPVRAHWTAIYNIVVDSDED